MTTILPQNHIGNLSPLCLHWPSPAGIPFPHQMTSDPSVLSGDMLMEQCYQTPDMSVSVKTITDLSQTQIWPGNTLALFEINIASCNPSALA